MATRRPARTAPGMAGRTALCALLAVAGVLLALGAVVDLWLQTLSFGGPDDAPDVGAAQAAPRLLLVALGTLGPLAAARLLLGRVGAVTVVFAAVTAAGLALAVLGLTT
jgi:hypothetical protein